MSAKVLPIGRSGATARPHRLRISFARKFVVAVTAAAPCFPVQHLLFHSTERNFGLVLRPVQLQVYKRPGRVIQQEIYFEKPRRGPAERECSAGYFLHQPPQFVIACARRSTGRGGSSPRLLGRRWRQSRSRCRSRRGRDDSRSRAWFTATVHHAHFSSAALADRGTHLGVRYADAID